MSDIIQHFPDAHTRRGPCRVSYTLNNTQPVVCTIVGDQPLFYMDFECEREDEESAGLFGDIDTSFLEKEIEALRKEIEAFNRLAGDEVKAPDSKQQAFREDGNNLCQPATAFNKESAKIEIAALKAAVGQSRLAKAYLEFAATHGVEIILCPEIEDAAYDRKTNQILINPLFGEADRILLAARELRRHWQRRQGALIHPLLFHPDNAILVNRAQSADLTVTMVRIAWELQLSGRRDAWERIENSSMGDLARAFAREAYLDFRTLNDGQAAAAAFETWFLSERCRHEDRKLIKQMLADYQGYVFEEGISQQTITPALIGALGAMPYGKNYLSKHAEAIMSDAVFTEVRDRSNANFLWFIKFERSFRETEQELQSQVSKKTSSPAMDIRPGDLKNASLKDLSYGNAKNGSQGADIVAIRPGLDKPVDKGVATGDKPGPRTSVRRRKSNRPSAEIVYLRRWSGE